MKFKLISAFLPVFLLAACNSVNDKDIADEGGEDYYGSAAEAHVSSFPDFILPEGWSVTEENENYIRMDGGKYFVTLSYEEPQLANGLQDYNYLGVTEVGSNTFETYSRLVGPAEPQLLYALVMEESELYVEIAYGEEAIQDEEVLSILSSLTYPND